MSEEAIPDSTGLPRPRRSMSRLLLGFAISFAMLLAACWGVQWRELLEGFRRIPFYAPFLTLGLLYLTYPLRAWQWRCMLSTGAPLRLPVLMKALALGQMGNVVLPLRGGEVLQSVALSRAANLPLERVLISVFLCRLQDLPALIVIGFATMLILPIGAFHDGGISRGTLLLILIAASCAALLYFRGLYTKGLSWGVGKLLPIRLRQLLAERVQHIHDGLLVLEQRGRFFQASGMASLCWFLFCTGPVLLLILCGRPVTEALVSGLVITAFTTVAYALPAAPAAVGTYEFACLLALRATAPDINGEFAFAFAVILHAVGSVGMALPAIVVLAGTGRRLFKESSRIAGEDVLSN